MEKMTDTTENNTEVTREDYERLEDIFTKYYHKADGDPEMISFLTDVGLEVKNFLQKYHNDAVIKKMQMDNMKEQVQALKHRDVKRALSLKQVENAINRFKTVK